MASSSRDPLNLSELDPDAIQAKIDSRDKKTGKTPTELDLQKEARLAEKEKRLASGTAATRKSASSAPSEGPASSPPPPQMDRSLMLDKISAYRERWPNLKKRNNVTGKSSEAEIADELHYVELQLGTQNGGGASVSSAVMYGTMVGVETFTRDYWNPLGLDLNGLATVTKQNMAEFQPILDELVIKHGMGGYTSPEWRLALMIGATAMTVNAANQNPDMARAVKSMNQAVNPPGGSADL